MSFGSNSNDFLETIWKNADAQEMQVTPPRQTGRITVEHSCKLIKKQMILRTSQFTLHRGIERFRETPTAPRQNEESIVNFKDVVIKKYEAISRDPSEKLANTEPKQLQVLKAITPTRDNPLTSFKFKDECYLMLRQMDHTLYEKIRYGVRQWRELKQLKDFKNLKAEYIHHFLAQITLALLSLHKDKIFLGGLRPTSIGVVDKFQNENKKIYNYYITDRSLANYQPNSKQQFREYDMAYIAPQFKQGLDGQSDIWSVGCILYEIMSCGQKLINDLDFHNLQFKQKKQFIKDRLNQLTYRIDYSNSTAKYKCAQLSLEVVSLLTICLQINPQQRISSQQLMQSLKNDKLFTLQFNNTKPTFSPELTIFYESKIIYDISMEIFRLSSIQDSIMTIFEELYFNKVKTVSKFHLYPLLKFASCYYMEAYSKLKDKSRCYAKNEKYDKYSQVKRIQDEKKLTDIRDKAGAKMIKEMEQQKQFDKKKEVLKLFPQIKDEKVFYPRDLFEAYLNYVKDDLCKEQNQNFYKPILSIQFYMLELPEMQKYLEVHTKQNIQLKFTDKQLQKHKDPEIVYFHRVNEIPNAVERRISAIFKTENKVRGKQQIEGDMKKYLQEILRTR